MTDMSTPNFTLITLSYQSGPHTRRCLRALTELGPDVSLIHADNASTDIDLDALAVDFPTIHQIRNDTNLGFAAGMNAAARLATTDWIGFINPDAFVAADWLTAMRAAIASHPNANLLTSLQLDDADPTRIDGAGDALTFFGFPYRAGFGHPLPPTLALSEVFAPCGAAMLIRRDLFERLGGFDERFFCYCEDADLGLRARLLGETCLFVPDARVSHIGSASTGIRSDFALWHGYRNRLWLYLKSMPLVLLLPTLPIHVGFTLISALKDTLKGRGRIVWPALMAAIAGLEPILRSRKQITASRRISALRLAKSLTWNAVKIATRAIDHRSLS